jgi:hypothetical protein
MQILIFTVLILFIFYYLTTKESFQSTCNCGRCSTLNAERVSGQGTCSSRSECPTRNMSYDLRGESYFPPRTNFPFDNSVIGPSNSRCYPKNFN